MKRLLSSTTALSLVLTPLGTNPAFAQVLSENGSVLAADGTILCDTTTGVTCDPAAYAEQAAEIEARVLAEEAAAAEAAAAEAVAAEAAAAEAAAAEAAAAEAAAAEAAAAEAAAAEAAAAEAAAVAAASEEAAAAEAAAEAAAAEAAAAEAAAAEAAAVASEKPPEESVEPEGKSETASENLTEEKVEELVVPEAKAEEMIQPATEPETSVESDMPAESVVPVEILLPEEPVVDPAASMKEAPAVDLATITPVEAVVPEEAQIEALSEILVDPTQAEAPAPLAAVTAMPLVEDPVETGGSTEDLVEIVPLSELPVADDAKVVLETLSADNTRDSSQEFAAAPVTLADGRRSGLTDFEKVGLVALGALVVGAIINEGRKEERRVVSNTGDRVVVLKPDGTYQVYKDDDTVLRRPGSTVRTETFNDGSTRTIVQRTDGSQIVTIRDASGRVLRRAQYDRFGHERLLIDDFQEEEPVIIRDLPRPKKDRVVISSKDADAALKARMAALEAKKAKRSFSLRQIRDIPEVRDLAAQIDVDSITFDSGSAAIKVAEAENLADLGQLMQELLAENPGEMFLVEGHTDAVGHPALNLALSDRRAESVALALAEYFDVPPENLVVQGYGESELLIDTQRDERANRRVVVRVITPLMKRAGG